MAAGLGSRYYVLMMHTHPFEFGEAKDVGYYRYKDAALGAAEHVRRAFEQQVNGGIDLSIELRVGKMVRTDLGLRLKETPKGCITLIQESLPPEEIRRLMQFVPQLIKPSLMMKPRESTAIDSPQTALTGKFHSVVLDFEPFDGTHSLVLGYYKTRDLADRVAKLVINMYHHKKVGAGFDTDIKEHYGNFMEYASGRLIVVIGRTCHEIKTTSGTRDFSPEVNMIDEKIKEWSVDKFHPHGN